MSDFLPKVLRYNEWRQWKPILSNRSLTEHGKVLQHALGLGSVEVEAVYKYVELTGFEGIEFVVIGSYLDKAPYRQLAHGITLVPCSDVLSHGEDPGVPSFQTKFLYDGWLPLSDSSEDTIRQGLRLIDETVAILSYSLRSSAIWFPKYIETGMQHGEFRSLTTKDEPLFDAAMTDHARLPQAVRDAVTRAAHWLQHGSQQRRRTDRFLAYWVAFESLVLTLYDLGAEIGLILETEHSGLPRKERRKARGRDILQMLNALDQGNAQDLVQRAYFDVVKGIAKRVRITLSAVLGDTHALLDWPYAEKGGVTPSQLRSALVHGGRSATELETQYDLVALSSELEKLTREIIRRTLNQAWGVELEKEYYQYALTMPVANMIVVGSPGVSVQGDFSISWPLLYSKGLL